MLRPPCVCGRRSRTTVSKLEIMVKKVTLDTLEIGELEIPLPARTLSAEEEYGRISGRWLPSKWLWIAALVLVMLFAAGGVSYWWKGAQQTAPRLPGNEAPLAASLQRKPLTAEVNDFVVTTNDDRGKCLVMTCDLTFELSPGQDVTLQQNIAAVRKIIYDTLKRKSIVFPLEPRIKNVLKEEINKSVSGFLGGDVIKNVYFTKFVVI